MRSSHNFAFRASQRHYTRPTWSIVSPRNERQNYSRFEMKGRISWFVTSVKMVSTCNKSLNIKTLSVNCDHRSKLSLCLGLHHLSCYVDADVCGLLNCCLRRASCAAPKHKAHTSPCPHDRIGSNSGRWLSSRWSPDGDQQKHIGPSPKPCSPPWRLNGGPFI